MRRFDAAVSHLCYSPSDADAGVHAGRAAKTRIGLMFWCVPSIRFSRNFENERFKFANDWCV